MAVIASAMTHRSSSRVATIVLSLILLPSSPHPFLEFPSLAYSFFRHELILRGVEWREPWHQAHTLDEYVRIVQTRARSDDSAWARSVRDFAGYVGSQISLPMAAIEMFPYLAVELAEDDLNIVKEVSFRLGGRVADPGATSIIGDLIAFQATQEFTFADIEEPMCPVKSEVGYRPAAVRVNGANCQGCTGLFGSDVGLNESCDIAKIVRSRLPGLFNGPPAMPHLS